MRWLFPDPSEQQERDRITAAMDAFWRAFEQAAPQIDATFKGKAKFDVVGFVNSHLAAIDPGLGAWDFGPGPGGHRFTVTPEADHHLRPMIDVFLSRAPKLPGWSFGSYRPPSAPDRAVEIARQMSGAPLKKLMAAAVTGEGGRIDVTVYLDGPEEQMGRAALPLLEHTLGEELLDQWIGVIDTRKLPLLSFRQPAPPLSELPATVHALIDARRDALPKAPWHTDLSRVGSVLRAHPSEATDYGFTDDLLTATTHDTDWWRAAHGLGYSSERFSRFGERFAYVKLDGAEWSGADRSKDRYELEDAVHEALAGGQLGGVVGGGHGLRYSYLDLALGNLSEGVAVVRQVLREASVPKRSWILFYDPELASEWVGVYDDTPPPPTGTLN